MRTATEGAVTSREEEIRRTADELDGLLDRLRATIGQLGAILNGTQTGGETLEQPGRPASSAAIG
jgi:hypothetical protein